MNTPERACTAHSRGFYEAETTTEGGLRYRVLRCDVCDRPQGMRLIRRNRTPRSYVDNPCTGEHDISQSATTCGRCGVVLCDLCGSDQHFTGQGHDLSRPEYWGI